MIHNDLPIAALHIDVNNAYLSWSAIERLKKGATVDLRNIPSIIGGDQKKRRGVVLAKSPLTKQYGIQTGETIAAARKKCSVLTVIEPNSTLYQKNSNAMMDILKQFSDNLNRYSIDECFIELKYKCISEVLQIAEQIKDTIFSTLGFTVNIGISTNKLLAKMASDFQKPNRIHTLFPWEIPEKMWPLPISDLFMVGKVSQTKLLQKGFFTIGDIAHASPELLERLLNKHGLVLNEYANGRETEQFASHSSVKGIGHSTTLPFDTLDPDYIHRVIRELCIRIGKRLNQKETLFQLVSTEIKTASFQKSSMQKSLEAPSDSVEVMFQTAIELYNQMQITEEIRHLGVRISIMEKPYHQFTFCEIS